MKCRIVENLKDKKCFNCGCIDMNVNITGKITCSKCGIEIKNN